MFCPPIPPIPTLLVTKSLGKLIQQSTDLGKVTGLKRRRAFGTDRGCGSKQRRSILEVAQGTLHLELEDLDTALSSAP